VKKTIAFATLAVLLLAGCGGDSDKETSNGSVEKKTNSDTEQNAPVEPQPDAAENPPAAATIVVPDVVGMDLQMAQDTLQAAGLYALTSHDATGQDRAQLVDRNWQVTEQSPAAGTKVDAAQTIDLGAEKLTDGAVESESASGQISVPDVVGMDLQLAQDTMQAAGLYALTSHDATGQDRAQLVDRNWQVTEQSPTAGTKVDAGQTIDLGAEKFTD
jgi:beta-lactam-binding protein with PASTA domain